MFSDIKIGPITFHMYGLMIALGFFAALVMTLKRGKKRDFDEDTIWGIFFCAIIGGMVGTRILYYIVEIRSIIENPSILWNFKNGYVVYGGIIGGILASYVYCRYKKADFLSYFDLVMPTQLISSAGDFAICGILLFYASKKPQKGRVASMYLMLYGAGRFAVEFLRNDFRGSIGALSTSQIISIAIVAVGILMYMMMPKLGEKKEAEEVSESED